jgi:hypothetical protein
MGIINYRMRHYHWQKLISKVPLYGVCMVISHNLLSDMPTFSLAGIAYLLD